MSEKLTISTQVTERTLCEQLRSSTDTLHRAAERSGLIKQILHRRAGLDAYMKYLRNLYPVYQVMEAALRSYSAHPLIGPLTSPELFRTDAIAVDLESAFGQEWRTSVPVSRVSQDYAARIRWISQNQTSAIVAHAYVRYLGDLNGGLIIAKLLPQSESGDLQHLAFHDFPLIPDTVSFANSFKHKINQIGEEQPALVEEIVNEAKLAFEFNINLSNSLKT